MNDVRKRRYERVGRSIIFCDERAADFGADTARGKTLAKLRALQKQIETLDAERATHERMKMQGTSGRQDERETLKKMIAAVNNTNDAMSPDYPEMKGALLRPKANSNDQTLLANARSIAAVIKAHKAKFVEYDMPPDIDVKFDACIAAFEQATQRQASGASAKASANAALEETFRAADRELQRLDTLIRNKYAEDPATLAAWERAHRLERPRQSKNGGSKGEPEKDPDTEK